MNIKQAIGVIGTHINNAQYYGDPEDNENYDWELANKHLSRASEIIQWIYYHMRNVPDNPFDTITEE